MMLREDGAGHAAAADPIASGRGLRRALERVNTGATTLIALVTAVVALLFQVAPGLKPDPRDAVGAAVSVFALEPQVSIDEWIDRSGAPDDQRDQLRRLFPDGGAIGEMLYVRVAVDGHKHRSVVLEYDVHDARTTEVLDLDDVKPRPDVPQTVRLVSPRERSVQTMWVPPLTDERKPLFIRVRLRNEDGILAIADSATIDGGILRTRDDGR